MQCSQLCGKDIRAPMCVCVCVFAFLDVCRSFCVLCFVEGFVFLFVFTDFCVSLLLSCSLSVLLSVFLSLVRRPRQVLYLPKEKRSLVEAP